MTLLDPEENDLLQSVENDEWISVENFSTQRQRYQLQAKEQIAQRGIELILSPEDTRKIQDLAQRLDRSIPSVTRDILHKYLQGELVEKGQVAEWYTEQIIQRYQITLITFYGQTDLVKWSDR